MFDVKLINTLINNSILIEFSFPKFGIDLHLLYYWIQNWGKA